VLFGHTHLPNYDVRKGVLYFNPGSCGPKRFKLPVTVGVLKVNKDGEFKVKIIKLDC
jgi:predicted phosphodiesterase